MTTTALTRRARLRARATREPYSYARQQLLLAPASMPVVPPASSAQVEFEGLFFHALRTLHFPDGPDPADALGVLEIRHLYPAEDRLVVDVAPIGAALTIAAYVFPELAPNSGVLASGVPRLRMRAIDGGVEFVRLDHPGSIIVQGVTAAEISQHHSHDGTCVAELSPHRVTREEADADAWYGPGELEITSSVVRRLGLFTSLGATCIDTWASLGGGISVEVFLPPLDDHQYVELVADLTSPRFTPRWDLLVHKDDYRTATYATPQFTLADGSGELDLRLRFD